MGQDVPDLIGKRIRLIRILSVFLVCAAVIAASFLGYLVFKTRHGGGSYLESISIHYSSRSLGIDLVKHLGLNETTASKFTNETLGLQIKETTLGYSHFYKYNISQNTAILWDGNQYGGIKIEKPKINYRYNISFHYIISSPEEEIRDIIVAGLNNFLNFSFIITDRWAINLTIDPEYSAFSDMVKDGSGVGEIWIVDSPNGGGIPGHCFIISPRIICWD